MSSQSAIADRDDRFARPMRDEAAPGWSAELDLRFERRLGRTIVASRRRHGPLMIQRAFHPEGDEVCHVYVLHPPGGIVGGDGVALGVELRDGAHALLTTPGATRWYFSRAVEASVEQSARLGPGTVLEWLPQETLCFDGAHARQRTRIELEGDARFVGWEIVGLGRPAAGEVFRSGRLDIRFELSRDGEPLVLERQLADGVGVSGLRGRAAYATMLATNADAAALEAVRGCLAELPDALCAATLIDDVLLVRGIAPRCEPLVRAFARSWAQIRPVTIGRVPSPPRIWRT